MLRDRFGGHRVPPFVVYFYSTVILAEQVIPLLKEPLEVFASWFGDICVDLVVLFGLLISIVVICVVLELLH
jgi:hypothetical protein